MIQSLVKQHKVRGFVIPYKVIEVGKMCQRILDNSFADLLQVKFASYGYATDFAIGVYFHCHKQSLSHTGITDIPTPSHSSLSYHQHISATISYTLG